ncbi:MAG TPA: hypothetical protein VH054_14435 [Polyangiaceae bacterium]|nr:hypothetical protein [Polyangiaceae bacterium]
MDVFDTVGHAFSRIEGFETTERERNGTKRIVGPSAGAIGDGVAYVGNRATRQVCVVDLRTLKLGSCFELPAGTDGVEYVAPTREVWVTTPETQSIVVLDAANAASLSLKTTIKLPGEPEGYAVDAAHGVFLTNLEDKGSTLAIDLRTHSVTATWNAGCSSDGPRGIAVDSARNLVFVACTDHVRALDEAHGGALLGALDTGAGVDNIDYVPGTGLLYVAAGKVARLTVAHVADRGEFEVTATADTAVGARNAVVGANGDAYVADPQHGRMLLVRASQ